MIWQVVRDLASYSGLTEATDNEGNRALHVAAARGHLAVVEALILASPSSITATNNSGDTFLHTVVAGFQTPGFRRLDRQMELMKHLLSGELFPVEEIINAKNSQGRTPLHLGIAANTHSNLVELLMTVSSIDVNIRDNRGATPLDVLRQRPLSASSELLTRHLISAGGIFTSQDYSARRVIASHIKRQSMGSSPGTSFRISDVEIFLYTGLENASGRCSEEAPSKAAAPVSSAAQRLKRLLHWPKTKEKLKKVVQEEGVPLPLRQRFSKPSSSLSSNKRTLSVRSTQPSPTAKKKLVMQAGAHRSRSSSFSKLSFSSLSSLDAHQIEHEASKDEGVKRSSMMHRHGVVNLCFGGPSRGVEASEPYDLYERSVLAAA